MRQICQFSCGAASAIATKLVLSENSPDPILIVNAFLQEEHPDNRRFLADCEAWFNHPILILRDQEYNASTDEVWRRAQYMKGPAGAPCSLRLKRRLLHQLLQPGDIQVIGFTCSERDRFDELCERSPEMQFRAPLIERELDKSDCLAMLERAGLRVPEMYRLGYPNANCIGCPKGGQAYWQNIRADFPQRFATIVQIQESIGPGAYFLQYRSGPKAGERMPLRDLPPGRELMNGEANFSCSFFCLAAEQSMEGQKEGRFF